jgi:hypothetical protein
MCLSEFAFDMGEILKIVRFSVNDNQSEDEMQMVFISMTHQ